MPVPKVSEVAFLAHGVSEVSRMQMHSPVLVTSESFLVRQKSCLPWMRKSATESANQAESAASANAVCARR